MTNEELKALRQQLKSGEYDGTDIMKAWIALDALLAERERCARICQQLADGATLIVSVALLEAAAEIRGAGTPGVGEVPRG